MKLLASEAGVSLLEPLDAPFRIHELGLACKEGVAGRAQIHVHICFRGTSLNHIATHAANLRVRIVRMEIFLHSDNPDFRELPANEGPREYLRSGRNARHFPV